MRIPQVKISFRNPVPPEKRITISAPEDAYPVLKKFIPKKVSLEHRECFVVMLLNRGHELLGMYLVSVGGVDSTIVDTRLVFQPAILANAESIILSHNHPNGKLKPSAEDKRITDKLKKAGEILGVKVIDHIIIGPKGYYSMTAGSE